MTETQIDEIMTLLSDKTVYWSTVYLPSSTYWWTEDINQLLKQAEKKYKNLTLVDWNKSSASHELDWFEADGFHPNESGSIAYTKLWIDSLLISLPRNSLLLYSLAQ